MDLTKLPKHDILSTSPHDLIPKMPSEVIAEQAKQNQEPISYPSVSIVPASVNPMDLYTQIPDEFEKWICATDNPSVIEETTSTHNPKRVIKQDNGKLTDPKQEAFPYKWIATSMNNEKGPTLLIYHPSMPDNLAAMHALSTQTQILEKKEQEIKKLKQDLEEARSTALKYLDAYNTLLNANNKEPQQNKAKKTRKRKTAHGE